MENAATILCTILGNRDYQTITALYDTVQSAPGPLSETINILQQRAFHQPSDAHLPPNPLSDDYDRHDSLLMLLHGFQVHRMDIQSFASSKNEEARKRN